MHDDPRGRASISARAGREHRAEFPRRGPDQAADGLQIQHLADPYTNKKYPGLLRAGYFEPIPMAWAGDPYGPLTQRASSYQFDDAAEERLYWVLNNSVDRDAQGRIKPKPQVMKPDEFSGLRMANARMRTAVPIDKSFASDTDYFVRISRLRL